MKGNGVGEQLMGVVIADSGTPGSFGSFTLINVSIFLRMEQCLILQKRKKSHLLPLQYKEAPARQRYQGLHLL